MADKAYITPNVLKWARETARMTEEIAASKVSVSVEKLIDWEKGRQQPTIKQAQILAKAYRRPFALFFLPEIPRDFQPLQDFRKKDAKPLGTASIFIIRELQQKQAWIRDVSIENGQTKLSFVGKFSIKDHPQKVASNILETLAINPANYQSDHPIKEWIKAAESIGVFVSRTSFIHSKLTLSAEEMQGFAIVDPYVPFVFVNSEDWNAPQLFTLVHELAHIWISESGVSNEIAAEINDKDKFHPVELFCNQVAANALMPIEVLNTIDPKMFYNSNEVYKIAKTLGVSSFALLFRVFQLKLISLKVYNALKSEAEINYQSFIEKEAVKKLKQKESSGGPNPYLLRLNKNGRLFTQIVLDAFKGGVVESTQASLLLNTPVNKFSFLEAQLYR